jgi:hypothetical protein
MSSLVFLCLSSHYRSILLPRYKPVPPRASVGYVQIISNDVAQSFSIGATPNLLRMSSFWT